MRSVIEVKCNLCENRININRHNTPEKDRICPECLRKKKEPTTMSRIAHFLEVIANGKSPHLRKAAIELHRSANFIKSDTKSMKHCQEEVAKSQVMFIGTLRKGNKVHICVGTTGNIEVGTVKEINDLTFTIKKQLGLRNLSEIQTIDFS